MIIKIHTEEEIEQARAAGRLAAELLNHLGEMVKPGTTLKELDEEAERWTQEHGARSAPLQYQPPNIPRNLISPFPGSICTSVNEVICHGIPNKRYLREGDIVNIDVTPVLNGWHGDTSRTFLVGEVEPKVRELVETCEQAMYKGIEQIKNGARMGDIGAAIQTYAEERGFSVVREFVGHGTGERFHCDPSVPHFGTAGSGLPLRTGMIFTVEPMVNLGIPEIQMISDWVAVTADRQPSAQFEHTILVTDTGVEILTQV